MPQASAQPALPVPTASTVSGGDVARGRVRPGDLWQLGRHRLLCGDSTDPGHVAFLMQGERATLTVTSPPYNLGHSASITRKDYGGSRYVGRNDALPQAEYLRLLCAATENALAASEVVIVDLQMLSGNKVAFLEYMHRFRHDVIDVAVWDKLSAPPAMARNVMDSRFDWLIFLTAQRTGGRTTRAVPTAGFRGTVANVYRGIPQRQNPYFRQHAATFPMHLPLWLMETFDGRHGAVFDPFLGTGTTLMAADRTERRCFGLEIEPAYCDMCLFRHEAQTGIPARRIGTLGLSKTVRGSAAKALRRQDSEVRGGDVKLRE